MRGCLPGSDRAAARRRHTAVADVRRALEDVIVGVIEATIQKYLKGMVDEAIVVERDRTSRVIRLHLRDFRDNNAFVSRVNRIRCRRVPYGHGNSPRATAFLGGG
ncbi:hypothetical protein ACJJTC_000991 [Scirpophaga incertulas]